MSTVSNSNVTLLLMTGLLSVGMATMGLIYLQVSSKKSVVNDSETSAYNKSVVFTPISPMGSVATPVKEPLVTHPKTVKKVIENVVKPFVTEAPEPSGVTRDLIKIVPPSCEEEVSISSQKSEQNLVTLLERSHSGTAETIKNPQELFATAEKSLVSNLTNIDSTVVEVHPASPIEPIESSDGFGESLDLAFEDRDTIVKTKVSSLEKTVKLVHAVQELDADLINLSEDFVATQAVHETADAPFDELLHESVENVALEHDEYVQVELTQSMTLSRSTLDLEDAEEANVQTTADSLHKEIIVEEKSTRTIAISEDEKAPVQTVPAVQNENSSIDEFGQTIASLQEKASMAKGEIVQTVTALHAKEVFVEEMIKNTTLSQDDESIVLKEVVKSVPALLEEESIIEEDREQGVCELTVSEVASLASPTSTIKQFASWEDIIFSPEIKTAAPAGEKVTLLSLDTPVEKAESSETLLIDVSVDNNEVLAKDTDASSPVSSGNSSSGKRHRNRSKKAKNKKKKARKHQK